MGHGQGAIRHLVRRAFPARLNSRWSTHGSHTEILTVPLVLVILAEQCQHLALFGLDAEPAPAQRCRGAQQLGGHRFADSALTIERGHAAIRDPAPGHEAPVGRRPARLIGPGDRPDVLVPGLIRWLASRRLGVGLPVRPGARLRLGLVVEVPSGVGGHAAASAPKIPILKPFLIWRARSASLSSIPARRAAAISSAAISARGMASSSSTARAAAHIRQRWRSPTRARSTLWHNGCRRLRAMSGVPPLT